MLGCILQDMSQDNANCFELQSCRKVRVTCFKKGILNKPRFPQGKMLLDIGTREKTFSDFNATRFSQVSKNHRRILDFWFLI